MLLLAANYYKFSQQINAPFLHSKRQAVHNLFFGSLYKSKGINIISVLIILELDYATQRNETPPTPMFNFKQLQERLNTTTFIDDQQNSTNTEKCQQEAVCLCLDVSSRMNVSGNRLFKKSCSLKI